MSPWYIPDSDDVQASETAPEGILVEEEDVYSLEDPEVDAIDLSDLSIVQYTARWRVL